MDEYVQNMFTVANLEKQWTAWYAACFWLAVAIGALVWLILGGAWYSVAFLAFPAVAVLFELHHLRRLKRLLREHRASLRQTQEILSRTTIG
jgi:membrane protein implicated in regulation of membrane protease activity